MAVETILVDGGSRDGTERAAREAGFSQVLVLPGANIPVCRNAGAAAASGDWLAYVDADCEVAEDWLEAAFPFLTVAEPLVLGWPARPPEPMTALQAAWDFHWLNKNRRIDAVDGKSVVRHEGFRMATTRNMLLHRSVWASLGGFNESLPTGEDTDFAFRAYMSGMPVLGVPGLRVVHHGEPATLVQFFRQQLWHANRQAYKDIERLSGGRIGGHAPKFALLFAVAVLVAAFGIIGSVWLGARSTAIGLVPLAMLVVGPAALISYRGGTVEHFPQLCLLYLAYGVARMLDLAGFAETKRNWKRTTR